MTTAAATTANAVTLVVSEVFGPTIQGEGPSAGRRAGFIRLGGCNLTCSWCDAAYTWDAGRFNLRMEMNRWPVDLVAHRALEGNPGLVVITGGETLLHQHQPAWATLLRLLSAVDIEVETNGTIVPTPQTAYRVSRFNVSPKLAHSGDTEDERIRPPALRALRVAGNAVFKFVVTGPADLDDVARLVRAHSIPDHAVWIMPEGTTPVRIDAVLHAVADDAIARGWNLTTRLHIHAWGNERGR